MRMRKYIEKECREKERRELFNEKQLFQEEKQEKEILSSARVFFAAP